MKKQFIVATISSIALLCGIATTIIINSANTKAQPVLASDNLSSSFAPVAAFNNKSESVFVIADQSGKKNKTFLGNIQTDIDMPIELKITYYLNGEEISAKDLIGKSGRVKISYHYDSFKNYQNAKVPFLAVTGLTLDPKKFSNIELENGKILSEGENILVAGISFAGLFENFNLDSALSDFSLSADVKDFNLENVYSFVSNNVFSDLDVSKLSSVDELISSMNQLGDGISEILAGSNNLSAGIKTLQDKSSELIAGINSLNSGLGALSENSAALNSGISTIYRTVISQTISTADEQLRAGLAQYGVQEQVINSIPILTQDNYVAVLDDLISSYVGYAGIFENVKTGISTKLEDYAILYGAIDENFSPSLAEYTAGVDRAAVGVRTISDSMPGLASGIGELYAGSVSLRDGIATFKSGGIDKLTSLANNDLSSFTFNLRKTISAAQNYTDYKKFVFKVLSIK